MSRSIQYCISIGLSVLALAGCNLDYFDSERFAIESYPSTYAVPVMNGSLTLEDMLQADTTLDIIDNGEGNGITLHFRDTGDRVLGKNFYQLPTRYHMREWTMSNQAIGLLESKGSVEVTRVFPVNYSPIAIFNYGDFDGGNINLNLTTDIKHTGSLTVKFPEITKNGDTLTGVIPIGPGISERSFKTTVPLNGYRIIFQESRLIRAEVTIALDNSGSGTSTSDYYKLEVEVREPDYSLIHGQLNNRTAWLDNTVSLGFLKKLEGKVNFDNPVVRMSIANSFGIYMGYELLDIYTETAGNPVKRIAFGGDPKNGFKQNDPVAEPGQIDRYRIEFTNDNTEFIGGSGGQPPGTDPNRVLSYAFEGAPEFLKAHTRVRTNWEQFDYSGFFMDTSKFEIYTDVYLPLSGTAQLILLDTFDYNFLSESDAENIDYVILKLLIENGLPVDADIGIDVYNENQWNGTLNKLFALKTNSGNMQIQSAEIDGGGRVSSPKSQTVEIRLEREQVKMLAQGEKMIVTSTIDTPDGEEVQLESSNELKLKMALKVKAGIPLDELN